jgi:cyanophycinase
MGDISEGNLLIIGGKEDKEGDCTILKKVIELSGQEKSKIVVITTATELPKEVGQEYSKIFTSLGAGKVEVVNIDSREDANQSRYKKIIDESTCIFFTGGDQLRITSVLGGTMVNEILHDFYQSKRLIVGTSAGASVMSETMIVTGEDEEAPKRCTLKMAPGLGLLNKAVIDQHFAQRGRIGRLLCAVAQNPYILGIGIDEDTAIMVNSEGKFRVIGNHSVTVVDGRSLSYTNVSELRPDENLALTDITLHILTKNYGYDMITRRPVAVKISDEVKE